MHKLCSGLMMAVLMSPALAEDGAALYTKYCAQCHDSGAARIPPRSALRELPREQILRSLESGSMRAQGNLRTVSERSAIADFLAAQAGNASAVAAIDANRCEFARPALDLASAQWNGWGASLTNARSQSAAQAGLTLREVPKLHLKWAFGFPNANSAAVQPSIVGRWVFVGGTSGRVYALDLQEGCLYWTFDATQAVRSAITVGRGSSGEYSAFFTDARANVYSLDAQTGRLRWKRQVGDGTGRGTGSLKLYAGRLYVPLTGSEEGSGGGGNLRMLQVARRCGCAGC
jgi:polyvinyl alcohol dehydrogenase (cytochrome)